MYNPCFECFNRYGKQYTEECDNTCEYAYALSKVKPYGGIDEAVKIMKGDAFPLVFLDDKHLETTYRYVRFAKKAKEEDMEKN